MICIIALIVFAVLSIFSATYRPLAKEAFDCVFRKLTLRKCKTGLDKRIKGDITGKLMKKHPRTAQFVYAHFTLISWFFTLSLFISLAYAAVGGWNFYAYGNCNGEYAEGFCVFDPSGSNNQLSGNNGDSELCSAAAADPTLLAYEKLNLSLYYQSNPSAENNVLFIGCFGCPYTREGYPTIIKLAERDDVNFIYAHFPTKHMAPDLEKYLVCAQEQNEKVIQQLFKTLFETYTEILVDNQELAAVFLDFGINLDTCPYKSETITLANSRVSQLEDIGVFGTPTVFVNGHPVIGPKPYRVYTRLLN